MSWEEQEGKLDEEEDEDKESWRAGRQRRRTRKAIREHVEGRLEEVKTDKS